MADFQRHRKELAEAGVSLFALSTDPLEEARATVAQIGLSFPVLYGLDGPMTAASLGAFYERRRNIIQPCAFILQGVTIVSSTYSTGPVGRLTAGDALKLIRFIQQQSADR